MKAGLMRRRVRIEMPTSTKDAFGAQVKTWTLVAEVDAQVDALSGREYFASDREIAGLVWRITLRDLPQFRLEPDMRATDIDSGDVFDLVEVLPSHLRDVLTIAATSGTSHS